jgi:predicted amidohydrolase
LALDGAEILCISALWPVSRIEHWSVLLRARAIENQLFVVGCNGCGVEGPLQYGGASSIVSPTGRVLAGGEMEERNLAATLDLEELREFRRHISCLSDRFPSAYGREV